MTKEKAGRIAKKTAVHSGRTIGDILWLIFKVIGTFILVGLTSAAIFALIFTVYIRTTLEPQIDISLEDFSLELTSFIMEFDHERGEWVEAVPIESGEVRHWVPFEEINPYLIWAAVAFEDRRFFEHSGVDWFRTAAAFHQMFLGDGSIFGASTITQQLIKNLTRQDEVTVQRKLLEIFRALELERLYTKEEILEWYLNVFALGGRINGVGAAAYFYYGVNQSELTLAQAASIVGITQFPTRYNPYLNLENNERKRNEVLGAMYAQGFITHEQYRQAIVEPIILDREDGSVYEPPIYTFFQEAVINDVLSYMVNELGWSTEAARNRVFFGGLQIYSTVDNRIQGVIDHAFVYNRGALPIPAAAQASMVIMDHHTGHIVGMGGRVGEKTANMMWNLATDSRRPPGSAIKPISVFGPAMELGVIQPNDMVIDAPVMDQGRPWPRNASGNWSRSEYNIVRAVSQSTNTISVRVLDMLGAEAAFDFMQDRLHVQLYPADADRAPLALGQLTHGITVREMTAAYAAFANRGIFSHSLTFTRVVDANGNVIIDNEVGHQEQAFRAEVALQMTAMLRDAVVNGTGRAAIISGMDVAGKTGSTDLWRDRYFAGYTPHLTASVWTGFEIMHAGGLPGTNPAAVIWQRVMRDAHTAAGLPNARFTDLPSLSGRIEAAEVIYVCYENPNTLATDACHHYIGGNRAVPFDGDPDDAPTALCTIHIAVYLCSETDLSPNDTCHTHVRGFRTAPGLDVCHINHALGDDEEPSDENPYEPQPTPTPSPEPDPEPEPDPQPDPEPSPEPSPDPQPDPEIDTQEAFMAFAHALPPQLESRRQAYSVQKAA